MIDSSYLVKATSKLFMMSSLWEDRSSLPAGDDEELSVLYEKKTHFQLASLQEQEAIIEVIA